ncbi:unnamed protein product [Sympodiomycopsis kandeliae]
MTSASTAAQGHGHGQTTLNTEVHLSSWPSTSEAASLRTQSPSRSFINNKRSDLLQTNHTSASSTASSSSSSSPRSENTTAVQFQFPSLDTQDSTESLPSYDTYPVGANRPTRPSEASSVATITPSPAVTGGVVDPNSASAESSAPSSIHQNRYLRAPQNRRHSTFTVRFSSSDDLVSDDQYQRTNQQLSSSPRPSSLQRHKSDFSTSEFNRSQDSVAVPFPSSASTSSALHTFSPRHSTSSHRSRPSSPAYATTQAEGGSNQPGTFSPSSSGIHARARLSSLLSPSDRGRFASLTSTAGLSSPPSKAAMASPDARPQDGLSPLPNTKPKPLATNTGNIQGGIRHSRGSSDRSNQPRHRSTNSLSARPTPSRDAEKEKERQRERAAAQEAERAHWERTRGAGSSVLYLTDVASSSQKQWSADDVLPSLTAIQHQRHEPIESPSPDPLLSRGVADYTLLPKILGRGKFSTVFMASRGGELSAIKHTALFPHHHLIATRLLREPTLLAELPPHPNLVEVRETIRTPGHFYLVEEYLEGYITLEALLGKVGRARGENLVLPLHIAEIVLSQLLSAVRAIHSPLQICHRDIKPENILVHEETFHLKLLDFGLATHFSRSEPKLTTCCGSPAFHCPEIVKALASPPGTVSYWGPDVDAWTCGVTMLRVLTGIRYPLGSSHSSLRNMAIRAQRAVIQIPLSDSPGQDEMLGRALRDKVSKLLEMDSVKRMKNLEMMAIERDEIAQPQRPERTFKSTTFIPTDPNHKMDLPLLTDGAVERASISLGSPSTSQGGFPWSNADLATGASSLSATPANSAPASPAATAEKDIYTPHISRLVMLNADMEPPQRVLSYIKYCLRCAGILYHTWPDREVPSDSQRQASVTSPSLIASQSPESISPSFLESRSDGASPPLTPFPQTAERDDAWSHVQLFQCVIEYKKPPPKEENGPLGGLGFVQSIMAAFGRRPTNRRSNSQPSQSPPPTASTPRGTATPGAKGAATPGESQQPRWLTFYMFVKFPKSKRTNSRPAYSRTNTLINRRSRASSVAAETTPSTQSLGSAFIPPSPKPQSQDAGSRQEQRRYSSDAAAGPANQTHAQSTKVASSEFEVGTHPDVLRAVASTSGSGSLRSNPQSRSRKDSRVVKPWKNKIIIEVTDERALSAVREALSVGGTTDRTEPETSNNNAARHSGTVRSASPALSEASEPQAPAFSDQLRKSADRSMPRGRRSQSYQGPRAGRSSGPAIPSGLHQVESISPLPNCSSESLHTQVEHQEESVAPLVPSNAQSIEVSSGRSSGPTTTPHDRSTSHDAHHGVAATTTLDTIDETQPRGRTPVRAVVLSEDDNDKLNTRHQQVLARQQEGVASR